jgi:hypothetical protein
MSEFNPKISERETEELIEIANSSNKVWVQDAINQAKSELTKREITEEEQNRFFEEKLEEINDNFKNREVKLKSNEIEKYNVFQMLLILIIAPFILIRQWRVLRDLKENNYTLKFKQRLVLLIAGMTIWFGLFYVEFKKWEKAEFNKPSRY